MPLSRWKRTELQFLWLGSGGFFRVFMVSRCCVSISQSVSQSVNQSITINQSINQSISQSVNQSVSQSVMRTAQFLRRQTTKMPRRKTYRNACYQARFSQSHWQFAKSAFLCMIILCYGIALLHCSAMLMSHRKQNRIALAGTSEMEWLGTSSNQNVTYLFIDFCTPSRPL